MAKVLVLYYSSWGHMEQMAKAAAEGAREAGADRDHQARARTGARSRRQGRVLQARPGSRRSSIRWNSPTTTPSSSASRPATARWPRR